MIELKQVDDIWGHQLKISSVNMDLAGVEISTRYRNHVSEPEPEPEPEPENEEEDDEERQFEGDEDDEEFSPFGSDEPPKGDSEFLISFTGVWSPPNDEEQKVNQIIPHLNSIN